MQSRVGRQNYVKGGGKGGKHGPKGGKGPDASYEFNGLCHHCGIWGHRRSECRRLGTEMTKKGGGKGEKGGGGGKKGGKGGPKGGKGPLLECTADAAEEWYEDAFHEDFDGEEWSFNNNDSSICSITPYEAARSHDVSSHHGHARSHPGSSPHETSGWQTAGRYDVHRLRPSQYEDARSQHGTRNCEARNLRSPRPPPP